MNEKKIQNKQKFNFEKLDLYKRSLKFSNIIFNLTKKFPNSERYGLIDQLKRASISISTNLEEGYNNNYKNDKMRYYRIARGSTHECVPLLTLSIMQNFIDQQTYDELHDECYELSCMISGLIKSINNRKN